MDSAQQRRLEEIGAEQLLGALAGVVSAHVVTTATGQLAEIHILATPELHPKQVVRNVESALSAGLGILVDRRIVSVAQIRSGGDSAETPERAPAGGGVVALLEDTPSPAGEPDEAPAADTASPSPRLEYVRHESRRDVERCRCTVTLRSEAGEVEGSGAGPDTAAGRAESAARAVFDALCRARPDVEVRLEGVALSSFRGRGYVIVSAHALLDRATVALSGAAPLARSPEEGAILAALQASNRWSG